MLKDPEYKILLIDDKPETVQLGFSLRVLGLDLIHTVKSAKEATAYYSENKSYIDGVIIDGMFYREAGDTAANDVTAFHDVLQELPRDLPKVLFTGQESLKGEGELNYALKSHGIEKFEKETDGETQRMAEHLKKLISEREDYCIRRRFSELFDFLRSEDRLRSKGDLMLGLLKQHFYQIDHDDDPYGKLRKVLEASFKLCADYGLLPPYYAFTGADKGTANIRLCSFSLSVEKGSVCRGGRLPDTEIINSILPKYLRSQLSFLGSILPPEAHETENEKSRSLIGICTLSIADFLIWLSNYVKVNSDIAENSKNWESSWKRLKVSGEDSNLKFLIEDSENEIDSFPFRKYTFPERSVKKGDILEVTLDKGDQTKIYSVHTQNGAEVKIKQYHP